MSAKSAVKSLQEYVKETETIELYFQQGSSDKVYHLQLQSVEGHWSVNAQWGRRGSAVQKIDGQYAGINNLGQLIPIDSRLTKCLESVQAQAFLVDGEITDSRFHLWDLLNINGTDLRIQPYEIRYARLGFVFRGMDEALRVCDTAMTPKAKRAFVKAMPESRA